MIDESARRKNRARHQIIEQASESTLENGEDYSLKNASPCLNNRVAKESKLILQSSTLLDRLTLAILDKF